jgi:hypothetical protein
MKTGKWLCESQITCNVSDALEVSLLIQEGTYLSHKKILS